MMTKAMTLLLLASLGVVAASPVTQPSPSMQLEARGCDFCDVQICDETNLEGNCYSGCYEFNKLITQDEYWWTHTLSAYVATGCTCTFGTPEYQSCSAPAVEGDSSIGFDDRFSNCYRNVGNFYCTPA